MNKFKLSNKIAPLDGYTSAREWIEHNLKKIDLYYKNQKQQGQLKYIEHLKVGRLISLGAILEEIKPLDFSNKQEYDRTITNLYRNFFAYYVIPALKDDILNTSDIRIIPVIGEIFSYKSIYTYKNPYRYNEICISGEEIEDIIPIDEVFCYCSCSIEFDISAKLESFFFGQHHTINNNIIYGKLTGHKNLSEKEIRKREKCLDVGVSYIKTVLGNDYFNQLITETLDKLEGVYVRILDGLQPKRATQHEVIFKGLLERLIQYIDDDDLKTRVQLEILLN